MRWRVTVHIMNIQAYSDSCSCIKDAEGARYASALSYKLKQGFIILRGD